MRRSSELFARAQKRIPGGVNSPVCAFRNVGGELICEWVPSIEKVRKASRDQGVSLITKA